MVTGVDIKTGIVATKKFAEVCPDNTRTVPGTIATKLLLVRFTN